MEPSCSGADGAGVICSQYRWLRAFSCTCLPNKCKSAQQKQGLSHGKCCLASGSWVCQWDMALNCSIVEPGKAFPWPVRGGLMYLGAELLLPLQNHPIFYPISEQETVLIGTFHVKFIPQLPQFPFPTCSAPPGDVFACS